MTSLAELDPHRVLGIEATPGLTAAEIKKARHLPPSGLPSVLYWSTEGA